MNEGPQQRTQENAPHPTENRAGDQPASPAARLGSVSVIVPCCGQLEYTRLCVPSLLRSNPPPHELVFLDAGSLDGTLDYLEGVAAAASMPVEVLRTAEETPDATPGADPSFQTRGEYVVLLSNDTIVPTRWLEHLVQLARMDQTIGMVGPMSNYAPPTQFVGPVPYQLSLKGLGASSPLKRDDLVRLIEQVNSFARQWREQHRGQWSLVDSLGGGCVLLKREVLRTIGPNLPRAPLGFFDLGYLSQRVVQAGYRLACCGDLFIHHFASRSSILQEVPPSGST